MFGCAWWWPTPSSIDGCRLARRRSSPLMPTCWASRSTPNARDLCPRQQPGQRRGAEHHQRPRRSQVLLGGLRRHRRQVRRTRWLRRIPREGGLTRGHSGGRTRGSSAARTATPRALSSASVVDCSSARTLFTLRSSSAESSSGKSSTGTLRSTGELRSRLTCAACGYCSPAQPVSSADTSGQR